MALDVDNAEVIMNLCLTKSKLLANSRVMVSGYQRRRRPIGTTIKLRWKQEAD